MAHYRGLHRRRIRRGRGFQPQIPYLQGRPPPLMPQLPSNVNFISFSTPLSNFDSNNPSTRNRENSQTPSAVSTSGQSLSQGYKYAGFDAAQKFPNAKERLHNILQGAAKEHKLNFFSEQVQSGFWRTTLRIDWPQTMSFCGEGWNKREAEKRAAALACEKLEEQGLSRGAASIIKQQEIEKEDEPRWIHISDDKLSRIESFLFKYSVMSEHNSADVPQWTQTSFTKSCIQQNQTSSNWAHSSSCSEQHSTFQTYRNFLSGTVCSNSVRHMQSQHPMDKTNFAHQITPTNSSQEYWHDYQIQENEGFVSWSNPTCDISPHFSNTSTVSQSDVQGNPSLTDNSLISYGKVKDIFSGLPWQPLSQVEQDKVDLQLVREFSEKKSICDTKCLKIKEETSKLPVAGVRSEIVDLILKNKVVVISGQTGCGKTTQIPQFVLDHFIQNGNGSKCNIVVTQPRRIVAMSIAERVAYERGENLGKSVGYQVRLEGKAPLQLGRILFCTTGILLRRMQNNTLLQGVSHVIVDEVHERDINTDFLLILLKDLLNKNTSIKIIVMSATVNADSICRYFHSCPSKVIPGFTHPVTELFLSDVQDMLNYTPSSTNDCSEHNKRVKLNNGSTKKERNGRNCADADVELVSDTILHVCRNYPEGGILCFLAGWDEITMVYDILMTNIVDKSQFLALPLHSMLPTFHQHAVFDRPATGVRKIVLATNIAETSITIDDIVYVINAGNVKEKTYDTHRRISCLMTKWSSQASVVQRCGRAGRCKPGFCFNLFTEEQFKNMAPYQTPEILRISLEEIVLQTKMQCLESCSSAQQFLSKALDPPSPFAVRNAISVLREIGALDQQEKLTALGRHMAFLPVEPNIAKMIIYGTIFRCLDPILTIAASLSYKDPFVTPFDKRESADSARRMFAKDTRSDHVAALNAFNGWMEAVSHSRGKEYTNRHFLHLGTLNMIKGMRDQFYRLLEDSGLLPPAKSHEMNAYSGHLELIKAIICAGLYPNLVKVGLGLESKGRTGKKRIRICLRTKNDGRVFFHPSSVNCDEKEFRSRWLIYHEKVKSTQVFIRDSSMIHPVALICFGGKHVREVLEPRSKQSRVILAVDGDRLTSFYCSPRLARVLLTLRGQLEKIVSCNVSSAPGNESSSNYYSELIDAVCSLLDASAQ